MRESALDLLDDGMVGGNGTVRPHIATELRRRRRDETPLLLFHGKEAMAERWTATSECSTG